ncbi:gas vesicle protein [Actinoallomurus sp. NPDC052308]|uniref:gas vesicle protein n=1 Tax=Actinoallomurus sp. NPDC052308 TaxID=3155530 RepID=UPI003449EEE3
MTEVTWAGDSRSAAPQRSGSGPSSANLADILERILDKGIVVVGDIRVNLLDIELLTIKIRLLVASVDRAKEMGIDWWEHDPTLSGKQSEVLEENRRLRERLAALEGGDGASAEEEAPALESSGGRKTTGGSRKTTAGGRKTTRRGRSRTTGEDAEADRG